MWRYLIANPSSGDSHDGGESELVLELLEGAEEEEFLGLEVDAGDFLVHADIIIEEATNFHL